jgi:hypothetical protein
MVKRLGVGFAVIVCVLSATTPAFAATTIQGDAAGNGFQISPVRTEVTINKGQSYPVDITITNLTNSKTVAEAVVNDFVASSNETGTPRLLLNGGSSPTDDFRQLVTKIPNVTLAAHATQDIHVTLTVPSTAASGGYYGAIRFVPSSTGAESNVALTASVGTLFLITVPGNLIEKVNLTQLSAAQNGSPTSFMTSGNVEVMNRLDNVGNIHVQPFGKVIITSMFGKTVAEYEFNDTNPRANVLPDSIRKFIDPVSHKGWFGHYTIQESLAYANGSGNLLTASAGFWYLPIWFLIVIAVIVIAIVAMVYRVVTRRNRSHAHRRR